MKNYQRDPARIGRVENVCASENVLIKISNETYFRSGDGKPTRKDQPRPDFQQSSK
jgi:hypothetical protein